jgi:Fur family transcriptional regulator, ferric uptake regulator
MKELSAPIRWLKQHRLRVTRARLALVDILLKSHQPLTLAELHHAIGQGDFTTVFRFLQMAEKKKLVRLHIWDDRQVRYELASADHASHHHHLVCKICRNVEEIETCVLASLEKQIAKKRGYSSLEHALEFFGICPQCQIIKAPQTAVRKKS